MNYKERSNALTRINLRGSQRIDQKYVVIAGNVAPAGDHTRGGSQGPPLCYLAVNTERRGASAGRQLRKILAFAETLASENGSIIPRRAILQGKLCPCGIWCLQRARWPRFSISWSIRISLENYWLGSKHSFIELSSAGHERPGV